MPHAAQTEREMGIRVAGVESDRALPQVERFLVILLGILGPAEIGRVADGDRQRRGRLRVLRIDRQRAPEIDSGPRYCRPCCAGNDATCRADRARRRPRCVAAARRCARARISAVPARSHRRSCVTISSCSSNRSVRSRSYRSAIMWWLVSARISWAVTRTRRPDFRTLPSST